jgi:glutamate racemase
MDDRPVGVFDSGVGGLSVLKAIRGELPAEDFIYVADSGYAPYGDRPPEFIEQRSLAIGAFLVARSVKALVVACNTATGAAVDTLRAQLTIPIVAMEPAVKPAAFHTKTGVIGVLATASTLSSRKFLELADKHARDMQLLIQPCPGLAEVVERGELEGPRTRALVERFVQPLLEKGADTLVLGCTHYPFLRQMIEEVAGAGVALVDPAVPVARELRRRLEVCGLLAAAQQTGTEEFWSSGSPGAASAVLSALWSAPVSVKSLPSLKPA